MANFVAMDTLPPGGVMKDDGTACFPSTKRPDGYKPRQLQATPFDFMTDFTAGLFQDFVANVQTALAVALPESSDDGDDDDDSGRSSRSRGGKRGKDRRLIH